jgi:GT2 family glycosyltransferase
LGKTHNSLKTINQSGGEGETTPWVSILISTWNNSAELDRTLQSLSCCETPPDLFWEVVLVNNNSQDETEQVTEKYKRRLPLVSVLETRQGLSHGRNAGIARAKGSWLIFTDDDVRLPRDWILNYLQAFEEYPEGFFFGGPLASLFRGPRPSPEILSLASAAIRGWDLNYSETRIVDKFFCGANWAVAAKDLRSVGGFDPDLGLNASREMRFGEESDLQNRLYSSGLKPVYVPSVGVQHVVPAEKCEPDYIIARAEALALSRGRGEKFHAPTFLKLVLSTAFYYLKFKMLRAVGSNGYLIQHKWRVRRGRLRGLIRSQTTPNA